MLLQGEPFAEFKEEWDDYLERPPPVADAIRLVNTQTEIIEEASLGSLMLLCKAEIFFSGVESAHDNERPAQAVCSIHAGAVHSSVVCHTFQQALGEEALQGPSPCTGAR